MPDMPKTPKKPRARDKGSLAAITFEISPELKADMLAYKAANGSSFRFIIEQAVSAWLAQQKAPSSRR